MNSLVAHLSDHVARHPTLLRLEQKLSSGARMVVRFNENTEKHDIDPDVGMMAEVVAFQFQPDNCTKITINVEPFAAHNRQCSKPNFYDRNGQPTLHWHETAYYPKDGINVLYVSTDGCDGVPFDLIEDPATQALFAEYMATPEPRGSYVAWLEQQLLLARQS